MSLTMPQKRALYVLRCSTEYDTVLQKTLECLRAAHPEPLHQKTFEALERLGLANYRAGYLNGGSMWGLGWAITREGFTQSFEVLAETTRTLKKANLATKGVYNALFVSTFSNLTGPQTEALLQLGLATKTPQGQAQPSALLRAAVGKALYPKNYQTFSREGTTLFRDGQPFLQIFPAGKGTTRKDAEQATQQLLSLVVSDTELLR